MLKTGSRTFIILVKNGECLIHNVLLSGLRNGYNVRNKHASIFRLYINILLEMKTGLNWLYFLSREVQFKFMEKYRSTLQLQETRKFVITNIQVK